MFKLVNDKPKKLINTSNYILAFAIFYIGKRCAIVFKASEKETEDTVAIHRVFDGENLVAYPVGANALSNLDFNNTINLTSHDLYFTIQLKEGKIKIKNRLSMTLDIFEEYTFNDLEMGLFKAARERARKKLKKLKGKQCKKIE